MAEEKKKEGKHAVNQEKDATNEMKNEEDVGE